MGKPIISTAAGGVLELLEYGSGGILVRPGDPEAIAEALVKLYLDVRMRLSLGVEARAIVEARLDWRVIVRRLVKIYEVSRR